VCAANSGVRSIRNAFHFQGAMSFFRMILGFARGEAEQKLVEKLANS
jgi:hypothetical protein